MNRLEISGGRIEYETIPGRRPTLVFLHEGLGSMRLWRDFPADACSTTGAEGLVWSRHGYGSSAVLQAHREPGYMHHEALVVLPELMSRLRLGDVVLVGHSDGASIALVAAGAAEPAVRGAIRGVIAVAPHVFVEDRTVENIAIARERYETGNLRERLARHHDDVDVTFYGWNDVWLSPQFRDWSIEEHLPKLRCPVLVVQSEDDPYGSLEQVSRIERRAGGPVTTLVLPHGGHAPHDDRRPEAEAVLAAIGSFYREIITPP